MDSVRSAFHTQLAAVMDTLLAAAVCEIAKIFESSMYEQQAEISSLLAKLEQVERRQRTKAGQGGTAGDRGDILRPKAPREAGKEQDGAGNNSQSEPKEVTDSITSIKQEPPLGSFMVQVPEESLAITDRTTTDTLTETHIQAELSHWDQGRPTEDHQLQQESASPPFFTISQTGHCSPRHDSSPAHPRQWLPRMDDTRGGEKSLQATGTSCFVAAAASIGTDVAYLQPETNSKDENDPFVFKEQKTENFNQTSGQGQRAEQTGVQQLQPQVLSPWKHNHDDRSGLFSHMRRTSFSNRDPLRLQSNSVSLKTRQANPLSLSGAPSGGNGRPYTCPYCAKSFTYPSHQRRHLLRHTGVRLHPCQFCDKSFLTPSELTVHTRTHTGERPFGCAQCGKRFARSGNLRAHQRDVHMQKRPFACAKCGKRFAHRGNLRVHNHRVHQGDPYYMEHQQEPDIAPNPI